MTELFLLGSLVITTVGTLIGYFIGRSEAKGEYEKINNRNLRAMNELENEIEELAGKLPMPPSSFYSGWHDDSVSDPVRQAEPGNGAAGEVVVEVQLPAAAEENKPKAKKKPAEKKMTPKRKKGKK